MGAAAEGGKERGAAAAAAAAATAAAAAAAAVARRIWQLGGFVHNPNVVTWHLPVLRARGEGSVGRARVQAEGEEEVVEEEEEEEEEDREEDEEDDKEAESGYTASNQSEETEERYSTRKPSEEEAEEAGKEDVTWGRFLMYLPLHNEAEAEVGRQISFGRAMSSASRKLASYIAGELGKPLGTSPVGRCRLTL